MPAKPVNGSAEKMAAKIDSLPEPSSLADSLQPWVNGSRRKAFERRLRTWFSQFGRDLPWRRSRDPYYVWVSEIMLQQTTVAAVKPFFTRFMTCFPTIEALAAAEESDVLRLWEGLGYYSRARNLQKAAKVVVQERGGAFPDTLTLLQSLPGVGRYTAGAIASFAYDQPAPIVEANTLRLYSRLLGYTGDPRSRAGQELLWVFADRIQPRSDAADFNAALMDLGATVCLIANPLCGECPVSQWCTAAATGQQASIPRAAPRLLLTDVRDAFIAVRRGDEFLLRQHRAGEHWAGLWDFPRVTWPEPLAERDLARLTRELTGLDIALDATVGEWKHGVTRFRITVRSFVATCTGGELEGSTRYAWVPRNELKNWPLPVPGRKLAGLLQQTLFGHA